MKNKVPLILPPLLAMLASPAYGQLTQSEANQAVGLTGSCLGNWDCLTSEEYLIETGNNIWLPPSFECRSSEGLECDTRHFNMAGTIPVGVPVVSPGADETPAITPPAQYILTGGVGSEASTSPVDEANSSTLVLLQEAALESEGSTSNLLEATLGRCAGGNRVEGGEVNEVSQAISAQPALLEGVYEYRQENSNKKLALGSNTGARAVLIASAAPKPSTKPPKKPHPVIRKIRTVCTFMQPIVSVAVGVLTILLLLL